MRTVHLRSELREILREVRLSGKSIGMVPTMGALHPGHGSLMSRSVADNDLTVATIFVNPTQFGPNEDLDQYPRTLEADQALLEELGVDLLFAPKPAEVYPHEENEVLFQIHSLNQYLCGGSRPGHFEGVLQVVAKLFNMVQADRAYFGRKDFQQLMIIRRMAEELFFPVEVIGCPIIRETDGLAMSSRNRYLNEEERKQALFLHNTLKKVAELVKKDPHVRRAKALVQAEAAKFDLIRMDYFEVCSGRDLSLLEEATEADRPHGILAAYCGKTRLIDNLDLFGEG